MNLNTLKKTIDKMKKKETPKYLSIIVGVLSTAVFSFVLFINQKIIDESKGLNLAISEVSQIRSECIASYEKEEGKFGIEVTNPEMNIMTVTVSWKTFFLINDSYSYSFIPTRICSN